MTYNDVAWGIMTYDDAANFEICGFHKNTKISISQEQNIISSSTKKIH